MVLTFWGAARTVTGACFLLETRKHKILVDCGLFQGPRELKQRNYEPFPFSPGEIDALLLTHSHIDHSGLIPKLYVQGFRGPIYATAGTTDLCRALLPDSAHIQQMEVERKNRKYMRANKPLIKPIYLPGDAWASMDLFRPVPYDRLFEPLPGLQACYRDAGHILGSAMVELTVEATGKRLLFSGDIGRPGQPVVRDPFLVESADYLVMESTYGNRLRSRDEDPQGELLEAVRYTRKKGGNLIIPAFAVERTQDLLFSLNALVHKGELSAGNVYVDSPLAASVTEIFCRHWEYFDEEAAALGARTGTCPLFLQGLRFAQTPEESMAINRIRSGAIIISGSGMCDAGRIKHHLKHNLWRPECTVLFVGYQAEGTLGRRILDGARSVTIHGEEVAVRADVIKIEGFSGHADQAELLDWLRALVRPPERAFLTHGEERASLELASLIRTELGFQVDVPGYGQEVSLSSG